MIPFITNIKSHNVTSKKGKPNSFSIGLTAKFSNQSITPQIKYNFNPQEAVTQLSSHALYGIK